MSLLFFAATVLLLGPEPADSEPRTKAEYLEALELYVVPEVLQDQRAKTFDLPCTAAKKASGAKHTKIKNNLASEVNRVEQWTYGSIPNTFPGIAASSSPTSDQTSTSERLAASIEASVPGSPAVKAGISLRPLALRGLKDYSDAGTTTKEIVEKKKQLDEATKHHAEKKADAAAKRLEARLSETNLVALRARAASGCPVRDGKVGAILTIVFCGEPDGSPEPPTANELRVAEMRDRAARDAADLAEQETRKAEKKRVALKGNVDVLEDRLREQQNSIKVRRSSQGRRIGESWTLRAGTFEDLGVRAGTGITFPFRQAPTATISTKEFDAALNDVVRARCREIDRNAELEIKVYVLKNAAAFIDACQTLKNSKNSDHVNFATTHCHSDGVSKVEPKDRFTALGELANRAEELECATCKPLGGNPPNIYDDITFDDVEKVAADSLSPSYLKDVAWTYDDWRAGLDAYIDFEPLVYGFAPRDDDGEATRLGRGAWRQLGAGLTVAWQGHGALVSATLAASATQKVEENVLQKPQSALTGEIRLQCIFGSLDPEVPLRQKPSKGVLRARKPTIACAPRRLVNPAALAKASNKLEIPHVAWFFAVAATGNLRPEPFEEGAVREASVSTGFDFIVSDKLKFRLGAPVRVALVEQEAASSSAPGPVIPLARGHQLTIPVFVTTVLAL